jgi:hypothetical protein
LNSASDAVVYFLPSHKRQERLGSGGVAPKGEAATLSAVRKLLSVPRRDVAGPLHRRGVCYELFALNVHS